MKFKVLFALLLWSSLSTAAVWEDKNQWNADWEKKYSDWIETEFNEEMFVQGNYKGIATDCADAVYAARLIFAYENKLPFVILDATGGSSKISNKMGRFDDSKESLTRVRKFLNFVSGVVSTKSLVRDTYPVTVSREWVRPGTVWSRPRIKRENVLNMIFGGKVKEDPGHAELVKSVRETGAVDLIGSTVPAAVRQLQVTSSLVFMPIETSTGFRWWVLNHGVKEESQPGYSLEQFKMGKRESNNTGNSGGGKGGARGSANSGARNLSTWAKEVQGRLQLREESKQEYLDRAAQNLCTLAKSRIDIVKKSEAARKRLNGECMNAEQYESHSTPGRDKRIVDTLKEMSKVGGGFTLKGSVDKMKESLSKCEIAYAEGQTLVLSDFLKALTSGKVSSNPNDEFVARWGIEKAQPKKCPKH